MNPLDVAKGMFLAGDVFNKLKTAGVFKWNNNRMKKGGAVKPQDVMKNYNMMLNHLMGHIEDYNEPIDPKDYKQSKVLINSIKKLKKNKPKKKSSKKN